MSYTARDVKDRVIQFPKRFKLTAVAGEADTYDLTAVTGTVTEVGTAINKAYLQPIEDYLGDLVRSYTATIITTGWVGTEPPFTQNVSVVGLKSTDNPVVDLVFNGNYETDKLTREQWARVYRITTANNSITVYVDEVPEVELPIRLKVVE